MLVRRVQNVPLWCDFHNLHHSGAARTSRARFEKHRVGADFMGKLAGFQRSIVHLLIVRGWHGSCYKPGELVVPLA
jgi:hypothetical protein